MATYLKSPHAPSSLEAAIAPLRVHHCTCPNDQIGGFFVGGFSDLKGQRPIGMKGVNRHAVRAPVVDLEEPEGATKWGFVSGCMAGLRHRHDSLPKSKESQIRALEKGRHQHSSSNLTLELNSLGEKARCRG